MTKVYRSKVDTWLLVILAAAMLIGLFSTVSALVASGWQAWWAVLPLLLAVGLSAWVLASTRYSLSDDLLLIKSGPFTWRVDVNEIHRIVATKNPLSSPALSLDRLRIEYGNGKRIMISPEDRDGFLSDLRSRTSFGLEL